MYQRRFVNRFVNNAAQKKSWRRLEKEQQLGGCGAESTPVRLKNHLPPPFFRKHSSGSRQTEEK